MLLYFKTSILAIKQSLIYRPNKRIRLSLPLFVTPGRCLGHAPRRWPPNLLATDRQTKAFKHIRSFKFHSNFLAFCFSQTRYWKLNSLSNNQKVAQRRHFTCAWFRNDFSWMGHSKCYVQRQFVHVYWQYHRFLKIWLVLKSTTVRCRMFMDEC